MDDLSLIIMKYPNQHKQAINKVLKIEPSLEKWQARIIVNRKVGELFEKIKDEEIKILIKNSEFKDIKELKALKEKIKTKSQTK